MLGVAASVAVQAQAPTGTPGVNTTPDDYLLVHAGTLLAVPGSKPQLRRTLIVHNGRIKRVAEPGRRLHHAA